MGKAFGLRGRVALAAMLSLLVTAAALAVALAAAARARADGRELSTRLVVYMSGYAQPILDTQGALDPHSDLLEKPFSETPC